MKGTPPDPLWGASPSWDRPFDPLLPGDSLQPRGVGARGISCQKGARHRGSLGVIAPLIEGLDAQDGRLLVERPARKLRSVLIERAERRRCVVRGHRRASLVNQPNLLADIGAGGRSCHRWPMRGAWRGRRVYRFDGGG